MQKQRTIDWEKLAEVEELKEFFEEDYEGFKKLIEDNIERLEQFSDEALNKFAKLRVLEVVNGCTQWGFRLGKENRLSAERTRECMNLVMGFIKRAELYFPSEGKIEFDGEQKSFIEAGRSLYKSAFKSNIRESKRQYYASSAAQFIVYGHQRIENALNLVNRDYQYLFSPHYIEKGRQYIQPYLEAIATS